MNKKEILEEIEKTKEHLTNMEKILEEYSERWKPNSCDAYYYIDAFGNVLSQIETGHYSDSAFWKNYNCFKTREQAKLETKKILVRRMLEDIARRLNKGMKIDWYNKEQTKYSIQFNYYSGKIALDHCFRQQAQGTVYCLDENFKDVAIQEIGEQRLKAYLKNE